MNCKTCGSQIDEKNGICPGCGSSAETAEGTVVLSSGGSDDKDNSGSGKKTFTRFLNNGRYRVHEKIGSGGMGMVHLALDVKMDATVVIKEMLPPKSEESNTSDYMQRQFQTEAKLLYRLSHRGIPKVTDFFTENGRYYLVMEQIKGQNLAQLVKERESGVISISEFYQWISQLLEILIYLHENEPPIIHRDIKPANIMIKENGDLVLVDFGLAKPLENLSKTQTQVGTLGYASPEHYTGKFCIQSDIYCLGASFHFLLSGDPPNIRVPFEFPLLTTYRKDIHPSISGFINKMLQKEKERRFRSAREALDHLRSTFGQLQEGMDSGVNEDGTPRTRVQSSVFLKPETAMASEVYIGQEDDEQDDFDRDPKKSGKVSVFPFAAALMAIIIGGVGFLGYNHLKTHQESEQMPLVPVITATYATPEPEGSPASVSQNVTLLLEEALISAHKGESEKAMRILDKAVKMDPNDLRIFMERGKLLKTLGRNEKALADFDRVISSMPDNIDAISMRLEINLKNGNTGKALDDINKLLSLKPDDSRLLMLRASIYVNMEENYKALDDMLIAQKKEPDNKKIQNNILKLSRKIRKSAFDRKDYKKALELSNLILKYDGSNISEYINRALVYHSMGMKKEAAVDMESVLKIDPENKTAKSYIASQKPKNEAFSAPVIKPTSNIPEGKPGIRNTPSPPAENTPVVEKPAAKPDSGAIQKEFEAFDQMLPPPPGPPANARPSELDRYNYYENIEQMMKNREYGRVVSSVESELKSGPGDPTLHLFKARALLLTGKYKDAEDSFNKVKTYSGPGSAMSRLADWYLEKMRKLGAI